MQGQRRRLETRKGVIVRKVEERGERKEWGASEMNGGDMGEAKAEERRCSSADFCGGPSNISPDAADVEVARTILLNYILTYWI